MPDQSGRVSSPECRGYPDENALCTRCGRDEDAHIKGRVPSPCEKYPHDGCGCPLDDDTPLKGRGQSPLHDELAARVRANLTATGTTQKALAERVGVTEKHVSRVLSGHVDGSLPFWDALLRESALPRFVRCNGGPDA